MKTVYLHIGLHKTGSTAIQNCLLSNYDLLKRHGYLYPLTHYHPLGQQALAYALMGNVFPRTGTILNKQDVFNELIRTIEESQCENIIISSENFAPNHPQYITELSEYFKEYQVKVVVYLRKQADYFQSLYQENIKWPNKITQTIDEFECPFELNYEERLQPWAEAFGKTNIIVRVFEKNQLINNDAVLDFLNVIDFNHIELLKLESTKANVSLDPIQIEMMRLLNSFEIPESIRHKLNGHITNKMNTELTANEKKYALLPLKIRKQYERKFKKSNKQLAQEYLSRDTLFFDTSSTQKKTFQGKLDQEMILKTLIDFIITHCK